VITIWFYDTYDSESVTHDFVHGGIENGFFKIWDGTKTYGYKVDDIARYELENE
jgi:hypothetical protein